MVAAVHLTELAKYAMLSVYIRDAETGEGHGASHREVREGGNAMTSLAMRRATAADKEVIRAILLEASAWVRAKGIDQWRPSDFTEDAAKRDIESDDMFLAFRAGLPVGTMMLHRTPGQLDRLIWRERADDSAAYVHRLAIRSDLHGQGLGEEILHWAGEEARSLGKEYLRLDCMADNEVLNRYYRGLGFTYHGVYPAGHFSASRFEKPLPHPPAELGAL